MSIAAISNDSKISKNITGRMYSTIINVIRNECKKYEYKSNQAISIVIVDNDGNEHAHISMAKFMDESEKLLNSNYDTNNHKEEELFDTEKFISMITGSKDNSDIHFVIQDLQVCMNHELGFSIKSQLGSPSTLLNAGESTNITYYLSGPAISNEEIEEINAIENLLPRMKAILEKGCQLHYYDVEHQTFKNNLLFLDTCMPEFIAECLIYDILPTSTHTVKDAVLFVSQKNPLKFPGDVAAFYKHKMKVLLTDAALGMTPAKEWKGKYDAYGSYLVVKTNGDIVCYHFYNRNDVEDYLFNNTRFERASRTRYKFGSLYRGEDGRVYIKLNLQIRFNK